MLTNPLEYYNDYDHWQTQRVAESSSVSTLATGSVSLLIDTCSVKVLLDLSCMPHPSSLPSRFLLRFKYTICAAEEVEGLNLGSFQYNHFFQVLVGDECTPSYTNRGGDADGCV